jgi:hypothetical protein
LMRLILRVAGNAEKQRRKRQSRVDAVHGHTPLIGGPPTPAHHEPDRRRWLLIFRRSNCAVIVENTG